MRFIKFVLSDEDIKNWLGLESYKTSTILVILKKNLGYRNQKEIIEKTYLDPSFLRIKLCWRTEKEFIDISSILNDLIKTVTHRGWGTDLINYISENRKLVYILPHICRKEEKVSLNYYTIENTIVRWIKEKF